MNATLIKNARVYAPEDLGVVDVLVAGGRILAAAPGISARLPGLETLDAAGKFMTPGFIDQHVHVTGGGGEGGPVSRTPEIFLSELVACGSTGVVGVAGTDFLSRSIENLLAKVRALSTEGANAWMYTSNYRFPPTTMSGEPARDMFMVPECLGVKIALGDHRSSFPTIDEVAHLLADIRLAGMISGKIGVLHVHEGDLHGSFEMYEEIVSRGFPIKHIRPTHCSRCQYVLDKAVEFGRAGGYVDFTTGAACCLGAPANAVKYALDAGMDPALITISTDGHGSMPRFNEKGEMVGLGVGGVEGNLEVVKDLAGRLGLPISEAVRFNTKNVADSHGLADQGRIGEGAVANLCLFDENFNLTEVMSKGRFLMRGSEIVVKGTFEE